VTKFNYLPKRSTKESFKGSGRFSLADIWGYATSTAKLTTFAAEVPHAESRRNSAGLSIAGMKWSSNP
jgi:hypothetical protein